jgi:hypothetical protein
LKKIGQGQAVGKGVHVDRPEAVWRATRFSRGERRRGQHSALPKKAFGCPLEKEEGIEGGRRVGGQTAEGLVEVTSSE